MTVVVASFAVPLLMAAAFVFNCAITLGNVAELSVRQGMTPDRLQGRMNATMRSLTWSMAAAGSLIEGALGDGIGFVPTLVVGARGSLASTAWLVFSPCLDCTMCHCLRPRSKSTEHHAPRADRLETQRLVPRTQRPDAAVDQQRRSPQADSEAETRV